MTQKEKTFLDQTAQRLHLTVDGESSILFGSVGGYQTMLRRNDQGLAVMTLSLHKLGQEPDQSAIRQFVKGTRLVTGFSVRRSRVELTLNVRFGNPNQVEKLAEAVAAVVEFLHASGYDNCCQNCGSAVETDPCIMTGVPSLLCDSCYQQLGHLQEQNQQAELGKKEKPEVHAGDIVAVVGVDDADIGDMVTSRDNPVRLDPIEVEEPTMAVVFEASTSPLVGREGEIVGARQLKERLMREAESNISMRIEELEDKSGVEVAGRGVLHLSVLMETMRREGFEFQVGRPRVLIKKDKDGRKLEPIEEASVDVPSEYAGKAIEVFGSAGGEMADMFQRGDQTHLVFKIPTRGTMGLRTRLLNVTRGEATMFHHFSEYGPFRGDFNGRKNGSMISMSTEKSVAYALDALQERGRLFVGPGEDCYEGMIVGESAKEGDMVVNIAKSKQLGNQRSSGADKAISLTPPITFTLEEALEYIEDDELVEITPKSIRLRKRILSATQRKKAAKH